MRISVDQVVTAGAYTAGMAVGGKIVLPEIAGRPPTSPDAGDVAAQVTAEQGWV